MAFNRFLKNFERKFSHLSSLERFLLGVGKIEFFLQEMDEALEDMFFVFLVDESIKKSLTNDWKRVEDVILLVIKQYWMKIR